MASSSSVRVGSPYAHTSALSPRGSGAPSMPSGGMIGHGVVGGSGAPAASGMGLGSPLSPRTPRTAAAGAHFFAPPSAQSMHLFQQQQQQQQHGMAGGVSVAGYYAQPPLPPVPEGGGGKLPLRSPRGGTAATAAAHGGGMGSASPMHAGMLTPPLPPLPPSLSSPSRAAPAGMPLPEDIVVGGGSTLTGSGAMLGTPAPEKSEKFRSKLCLYYLNSGGTSCKYGDSCMYAHGQEQLRLSADAALKLQQEMKTREALEAKHQAAATKQQRAQRKRGGAHTASTGSHASSALAAAAADDATEATPAATPGGGGGSSNSFVPQQPHPHPHAPSIPTPRQAALVSKATPSPRAGGLFVHVGQPAFAGDAAGSASVAGGSFMPPLPPQPPVSGRSAPLPGAGTPGYTTSQVLNMGMGMGVGVGMQPFMPASPSGSPPPLHAHAHAHMMHSPPYRGATAGAPYSDAASFDEAVHYARARSNSGYAAPGMVASNSAGARSGVAPAASPPTGAANFARTPASPLSASMQPARQAMRSVPSMGRPGSAGGTNGGLALLPTSLPPPPPPGWWPDASMPPHAYDASSAAPPPPPSAHTFGVDFMPPGRTLDTGSSLFDAGSSVAALVSPTMYPRFGLPSNSSSMGVRRAVASMDAHALHYSMHAALGGVVPATGADNGSMSLGMQSPHSTSSGYQLGMGREAGGGTVSTTPRSTGAGSGGSGSIGGSVGATSRFFFNETHAGVVDAALHVVPGSHAAPGGGASGVSMAPLSYSAAMDSFLTPSHAAAGGMGTFTHGPHYERTGYAHDFTAHAQLALDAQQRAALVHAAAASFSSPRHDALLLGAGADAGPSPLMDSVSPVHHFGGYAAQVAVPAAAQSAASTFPFFGAPPTSASLADPTCLSAGSLQLSDASLHVGAADAEDFHQYGQLGVLAALRQSSELAAPGVEADQPPRAVIGDGRRTPVDARPSSMTLRATSQASSSATPPSPHGDVSAMLASMCHVADLNDATRTAS